MHMGGQKMKIKTLVCAVCSNHCKMEAQVEDGEILDVSGNGCMKGFIYAQQEADSLENTDDCKNA